MTVTVINSLIDPLRAHQEAHRKLFDLLLPCIESIATDPRSDGDDCIAGPERLAKLVEFIFDQGPALGFCCREHEATATIERKIPVALRWLREQQRVRDAFEVDQYIQDIRLLGRDIFWSAACGAVHGMMRMMNNPVSHASAPEQLVQVAKIYLCCLEYLPRWHQPDFFAALAGKRWVPRNSDDTKNGAAQNCCGFPEFIAVMHERFHDTALRLMTGEDDWPQTDRRRFHRGLLSFMDLCHDYENGRKPDAIFASGARTKHESPARPGQIPAAIPPAPVMARTRRLAATAREFWAESCESSPVYHLIEHYRSGHPLTPI